MREIGLSISTVRSGKIAEQAVQAAITVRMFALPPRGRTLRYLLGAVSPIAPYLSAISLQENHFHFHVGVAGLGLTVLPTRISLRNAGLQEIRGALTAIAWRSGAPRASKKVQNGVARA